MTADDEPAPAHPPEAGDARFTLAAERTVFAWLRTALGLIAAGVAALHVIGYFTSSWAITVAIVLLAVAFVVFL